MIYIQGGLKSTPLFQVVTKLKLLEYSYKIGG
jgi:hypothetical protein